MMTFLLYRSFKKTFKYLDDTRLGKQRVEALQILNTLSGKSSGWKNHPAVLAWKGYEEALKHYLNRAIYEWVSRGYKNKIPRQKIDYTNFKRPPWTCWRSVRMSHRAMLIRKMPLYYTGLFPKVLNSRYMTRGYIWPVSKDGSQVRNSFRYTVELPEMYQNTKIRYCMVPMPTRGDIPCQLTIKHDYMMTCGIHRMVQNPPKPITRRWS